MADTLGHCALDEADGAVAVRASPVDRTTLELSWAAVETAIKQAAGGGVRVTMGAELAASETPAPASNGAARDEPSPAETEAAERALADPDVQAFQQRFPGQVREVRNLRDFSQ